MKHIHTPAKRTAQRLYTDDEVQALREAAFREGYGVGADNTQLEHRMRPFLLEDEAVMQWLNVH